LPLRLHDYAPSANCYKVRLLLAQLGRDYERVAVDIFGGDTLTDEFGRMNPARRTPVLEPFPGTFIPESNAILLYLAEGTAFLPTDPIERAQTHRWMFFEQNAFEGTVGTARFWRLTGRAEGDQDRLAAIVRSARAALGVLEAGLRDDGFVVGDEYTVADTALYGYGHVAHEAGIDTHEFPRFRRWCERVAALPGTIHDLVDYPANARPGRGRGIRD
jgi:glutathione S-transferase